MIIRIYSCHPRAGAEVGYLAERVVRVEESAKQAHLRLDRMEKVEE